MNERQQQQQQAYFEVITALLNCPEGEELTVYQEFAHLFDPNLVTMMAGLADRLESQGDDDAPRLRQLERNLSTTIEEWKQLNQQAMDFRQIGDLAATISHAELAITFARGLLPGANIYLAISLNNLALLYKSQEQWAEAEPLYKEAIDIYHQLFGTGVNQSLAMMLNNLGGLYLSQGQWEKAEPLLLEAVTIFRQSFETGINQVLARSLNNLAELYRSQSRWAEAEPLLLETVTIFRQSFETEINQDLARSLNNLAEVYQSQGRQEKAEPLLIEAVTIFRQSFETGANRDLARSLDSLASLYQSQRRWEEAELHLLDAVKICRELFGVGMNQDLASCLNNLAELYQLQGRWAEAEPRLLESVSIFRHLFGDRGNKNLAVGLSNLAVLCASTERYPEALALFIEAIQVENQLLSDYLGYATPENQLILLEQMHSNLETLISLVWQHFPTDITAQAAAQAAILKRKAASTISNSLLNAAQYNDRYPHLHDRFDRWQQLKQQIALGGDRVDETIRRQLEDECRQLYQSLAREVPEIKATSMDIDRQAIALYLPTHSVLVEFFRFKVYDFQASELLEKIKPARYIAFIITPNTDTPAELIDLGEADAIDELVQKYRHAATTQTLGMDDDDEDSELPSNPEISVGCQLRTCLLDPIFDLISAVDTLILAADGDLYRVPFATLPLDDTGNLVIDKYRVETLTAARDIRRRQENIERPAATPILVADPDYDYGVQASSADLTPPPPELDQFPTIMGGKFSRLEMTSQLAHSIAERLKINPYLKESATETLFHNQTRSPQYLIVATHGFADASLADIPTTDPMQRCGIALAGANGWLQGQPLPPDIGKGVLLAHDIAQLNLWGTEIVVLVACSTALGDTKSGQGIFGLRRALALAGAKHAIVSLWDVPARASMLLMNYFFDDYLAGVAPSQALHQAQNRVRQCTIQELSQSLLGQEILEELHAIGQIEINTPSHYQPLISPFFWGAWICQG